SSSARLTLSMNISGVVVPSGGLSSAMFFAPKKDVRPNEGLSERKVERDCFGIKQRRRGMWRRRTGRTIRGILLR
ncbi:hypothetical protein, partial [Klebsiella quasipneumoniae]|uniref:hypothetical protein n=1 Tax=Klebsiella quasipneumoniae TaxID=1463165 RepID=UPI001A90F477